MKDKSRSKTFIVVTDDDNFDPRKGTSFEFSVKRLKAGTHVINVDRFGRPHEFNRWLPPELVPETNLGKHALIQMICHLTAMRFNMDMEHLCGRDKKQRVDSVRKIAVHICCEAFRHPCQETSGVPTWIMEMIGNNLNRHRTQILHLDKWLRDRLDILPEFVASIAAIKEKVESLLPLDESYIQKRFGTNGLQGES